MYQVEYCGSIIMVQQITLPRIAVNNNNESYYAGHT